MNENYKIVGIRYPNYYDRVQNRTVDPTVVVVEDKSKIKQAIENLLFSDDAFERVNYVLVKWAGKMYTCDPMDFDKRQFVKTEVTFHPYQHLA